MLESGIRNQESGIRIPVRMWAIRQIRNQESGIKWSIKNRKRDRRIGRGEQNQELALAALVPRESERKRRKREWRIRKLKAGPRWESLGRESEYLSRRGTWEGESSEM